MTDKEKKRLDDLKKKEAEEKKEAAKRQRAFKDMCKKNFGLTPTEIADMIKAKNTNETDDEKLVAFAKEVATKYELNTQEDFDKWMQIVPNPKGLEFWRSNRNINRSNLTPRTDFNTPT